MDVENKIQELRKDIAELEALQNKAERHKVKDILNLEARRLGTELSKLEDETRKKLSSPSLPNNRCYQVKLTNYAWDQTDKFVKFYITLQNVHTIPSENIQCSFNTRSLELQVKNLDNKDYVLNINNLLKPIIPEQSNWKVKTGMILINAAKSQNSKWDFVTETEKRSNESRKMPAIDPEKDPSEGLMSLMKNMYEQGDDELKRTIAKTWYESQQKGPAF